MFSCVYFTVNGTLYLYRPLFWARTIKRFGTGILTLQRKLSVIYLTPLSIGIKDLQVNLKQTPENCLSELKAEELETKIRNLLLYDFENATYNRQRDGLQFYENICNMHNRRLDGDMSDIYFECCHLTPNDNIKCHELKADWQIELFLYCIRVAKLLVVLFLPYLIPKSYFRDKFKEIQFEQKLPKDKYKSFILKLSKGTDQVKRKNTIPLNVLREKMPNFYQKCSSIDIKDNSLYEVVFEKLQFKVNATHILSKNEAPVKVLNSLYRCHILDRIRHEEPFEDLCNAQCLCGTLSCTWFKCCRLLAKILLVTILSIPWIFRILIHYAFENEEYRNRDEHFRAHGLNTQISWNLITELTPAHPVFLVCYIILGFSSIVLFILDLWWPCYLRPVQKIVRKSFRDTNNNSASRLLKWIAHLVIRPFNTPRLQNKSSRVRFHKCTLRICAVPLFFIAFPLYIPPTINLIFRLVVYSITSCFSFCTHDDEQNNDVEKRARTDKNRENDADLNSSGSSSVNGIETNHGCRRCLKYDIFGFNYFLDIDFNDIPKVHDNTKAGIIIHTFILILCIMSILSGIFLAVQCIVFFVEWITFAIIGVILNSKTTFKFVTFIFMIILYFRECFESVAKKFISFNKEIHDLVVTRLQDKIKRRSTTTIRSTARYILLFTV